MSNETTKYEMIWFKKKRKIIVFSIKSVCFNLSNFKWNGFMVTLSILVCLNRYYMLNFILRNQPTKSEQNKIQIPSLFFLLSVACQAFVLRFHLSSVPFMVVKTSLNSIIAPNTALFVQTPTIGMMHTILITFRLSLPPMLVIFFFLYGIE